jgi:HSP20 family molecular chaperone IbpA
MAEQTQTDFQLVKKRGPKSNQPQNTNQKKLSFKELLFEQNNLKKYQHSPKVDLRECNNTYIVLMELAGLSQSEVSIQVQDLQFLLVSGTKNNQKTQESDTIVYSECHYGNFMCQVN